MINLESIKVVASLAKNLLGISLVIGLTFLISCRTTKAQPQLKDDATSKNDSIVDISEVASGAPKIAFVSYNILKDENGKISFELLDVILAEGKLKPAAEIKTDIVGNYEFIQLDIGDKQLAIVEIANPLIQIVEFVNDNGDLEKKKITYDSKEVFIRVQLHVEAKYILMREIGNESTNFIKTSL